MPGAIVHLQLAERVLETDSVGITLDTTDRDIRQSVLLGALFPDSGYYPGGAQLLTDLAHYLKPASLLQSLWEGTRTATETAFVLGWATHVLADVAIHPIINRGAAAFRGRSENGASLTYAEDPVAHAQVETGLDWAMAARSTELAASRVGSVAQAGVTRLVQEAYLKCYRIDLKTSEIRRCAVALSLCLGPLERAARTYRSEFEIDGKAAQDLSSDSAAIRIVGKIAGRLGPGSMAFALSHPVRPSESVLAATDAAMRSIVDGFDRVLGARFTDLENRNLDTGLLEEPRYVYPLSAAAAARLEQRVGSRTGDSCS